MHEVNHRTVILKHRNDNSLSANDQWKSEVLIEQTEMERGNTQEKKTFYFQIKFTITWEFSKIFNMSDANSRNKLPEIQTWRSAGCPAQRSTGPCTGPCWSAGRSFAETHTHTHTHSE